MAQGFNRREAIGMAGGAALVAPAALVGTSTLQAQPAPAFPGGLEALAWLRRAARPLPSVDPTPDTLRPLVAALEGAQVIGVGEATNGSHEDQALKAAIIRALIVHGNVRVLAVEGNRRAAMRLDEYVRGGGPDPIATMREGGLFQAWQTEPFAALISWIRAWNVANRGGVRIIGVDVGSSGSDAYEAYNFVRINAPRFVVNFERPLAPFIASPEARSRSVLETAQRLSPSAWQSARDALDLLYTQIQGSTRPGADVAARAAASARRAMDLARAAGTNAADAQRIEASMATQRERLMAENLLEQAGTDRTVLWAHNLNVMAIDSGTAAHLRRRLTDRYRAVVIDYERGSVRTKPGATAAAPADGSPWQTGERRAGPLSLGSLLGQAGPDVFWTQLTGLDAPPAALLAQPFGHDWPQIGGSPPDGGIPLRQSVDVLAFVRTLTPSRLFPFVPGA